MESVTQSDMGTLMILLDFVGQKIWPLIFLVFLFIARKSIAGLVERITKLNFSWGKASGGVEAPAPSPEISDEPKSELEQKVSPPSTKELEQLQMKGKEEEAKDWFPKMYQTFIDGESAQATQIFEARQRDEKDADQRHSNEALFLHFLYTYGNDPTALVRLKELHARSANEKQRNSSMSWLSWSYTAVKDYDKAERLLREAIPKVVDEEDKTSFIISLASIYKNKGDVKLGIDLVEERLLSVVEHEQRTSLYLALSTLEVEKGDTEAAAIALEKVVEFSPGNQEKLFNAAYAQSKEKLQLLSISNYLTLSNLKYLHATVLNNLGVCASEFKFDGKQIALYRKAKDEGSTLAVANMANLLITGGFWEEAKEILDKARVMDDPHENVSHALYRLQTLQKEEEEKWSDLTKKAEAFQRKVRLYGDALFDRSGASVDYSGVWYTKRGEEVSIEVNGENVNGEWSEVSEGLLAISTRKCSVFGTRRNRSAAVTYQRRPEGESRTTILGGSLETSVKCYSYFSTDQQTWEFFPIDPEEKLVLTLCRKTPN